MKQRPFGPDGTLLPLLGLGCSRIGSLGNPVPMRDMRRLLERSLELGVSLFDTADIYGQGDSEREIGTLIAGRRDQAFVVTKCGKKFSRKMQLMRSLKPILKPLLGRAGPARKAVVGQRDANLATDFSPAHIAGALNASLRRLGTDHVDALLLHSPPASDITPAVADALEVQKRDGKLRHWGMSCDDLPALEASLALPGLALVELPMDVLDEAIASGLTAEMGERGIGILAREVLRMQPGLSPGEALVQASRRDGVTSVILGTSSIAHLEHAVATLEAGMPAQPSAQEA